MDIICRNAPLHLDRTVSIYGPQRINFSQYNASSRVNSLIQALHSLGLNRGGGIGILSWNCLEYTAVYGTRMRGGFKVSPFNPRMQKKGLDYIVHYSEVKALFMGEELAALVNELRPSLSHVQ